MKNLHKPFRDCLIGQVVFTLDRFEDEIRETYYIRGGKPYHNDQEAACRYAGNVRMERLGFVQGNPNLPKPRISKITPPCGDPGEMPGATPVYDLHHSRYFWDCV